MTKQTREYDLGAGWYATFHTDGELFVHSASRQTEIRLPAKSVERLKKIIATINQGVDHG